MRTRFWPVAIAACLSAPTLAFDLNSMLDTVNKAVGTVKNAGSAITGAVSVAPNGDTLGGSVARFKVVSPSPLSPELPAKIDEHEHSYKELDEYTVLMAKPALNHDGSIRVASSQSLRGQVYRDQYNHPDNQSTLQVWESYRRQLAAGGYQFQFVCDKPCASNGSLWYKTNGLIVEDRSDRYLVARKDNTWVTVIVGQLGTHPRANVNVIVASE